ncbi:MAG TPA: xanthine dehydrogenase family protein molybdopterin-binding subunit [Candidatus Micrarchaeaceae archaeon]|nr:xanthine dehydrogenase family protein molybdopterin-binding subunit [Candidatus Micrarchaeaceae archaeon]
MRRLEDPRLITGHGIYAGDHHVPGMVHLVFVRAGIPSARLLRVDLSVVRAMPGVVGAWDAAGLGVAGMHLAEAAGLLEGRRRRPLLATGRVHHEGDAVAVIVAETEYAAHDALNAAVVEVEPELDAEVADHEVRLGFGDADAAFADAVTVSARFRLPRICGAALEPRAVFAEWDASAGVLTVTASVGAVYRLRTAVADALGLPPEKVVALSKDVGGSFGPKNGPYAEYVLAAMVARLLNRPVRWVATRTEDGQTTGQGHGSTLEMELAATPDGRLLGVRGRMVQELGAYYGMGATQGANYVSHLVSAYVLPAVDVLLVDEFSPGPASAHVRGGGRPSGNFAIERLIDRMAARLEMDPVELRRRNLITPSQMPYNTGFPGQVYDGGDYPRLLMLASEQAGYENVRRRQTKGEPVGVGIACCVESTGFGAPEPSRVRVLPSGDVEVFVGTAPGGQGHETFAAQVAADRLGWPIDRIRVLLGDSRVVSTSGAVAGSRSALEVGNSVALSAAATRQALLERASQRLEVDPADIVLGPAGATVKGVPGRGVVLSDLISAAGLEMAEVWDSKGAKAWASSCHAAVVRVDVETGEVKLERYVIAHDSGRVINPLLLEGQLHGGFAHGLGYALFEEAVYLEDGTLLSPSFLDYAIVSAPDLSGQPELVHTETPSTQNPEGFRGVGEAGTVAVPAAIANAIEDALCHLGLQVVIEDLPVTPQRLYKMLHPD